MKSRAKLLEIDSMNGGFGDIWMRLVGFYTMAKLLPEYQFNIKIPSVFYELAKYTFQDRINIVTYFEKSDKVLSYTHLGIKDLIKPLSKGQKFISPYQRVVIHDKKKKALKDYINIALFYLLNRLGLVQIPSKKWITEYQSYLEVIGIKKFKHISYLRFLEQLILDSNLLNLRLQGKIPISSELEIPQDLKNNLLFFPTGTSRQFVPIWWAVANMPNAYYAFYCQDEDAKAYASAGLKVVYFFKEPGDIICLSRNALWTLSTDSFPSHLLQYSNKQLTIVLTELSKSRIVSPAFQGKIVHAVAPCHPCLHMARKVHPLCTAGYNECLNWQSKLYTQNIVTNTK